MFKLETRAALERGPASRVPDHGPALLGRFVFGDVESISRSFAEELEDAFQRCRDMDASLGERPQALANAVQQSSAPFAETVDRLISRLQQSGAGATAPQPGDLMPPFHLPDEQGRPVALSDLFNHGPVAVTSHRGHWCPYQCLAPIDPIGHQHWRLPAAPCSNAAARRLNPE